MLLVNEVGLPGADMDLGVLGIAEIPDHEDIALVGITTGVPLLMDSDSIDTLLGGVFDDGDVVEVDADVVRRVESLLQIVEILLLALLVIDDGVAGRHEFVFSHLHHSPGDDEGVV